VTVVLVVAAAMLGLAAALLVVRITVGPTVFDRSIALDVLMAVAICGVALHAAHTRQASTLPALLVLSLVGFVGAVSIARFARGSDDVEAERDDPDRGSGR